MSHNDTDAVSKELAERMARLEPTIDGPRFNQKPLGTCSRCDKQVFHNVVNALDKAWHEDCFTCYKCGTTLLSKAYGTVSNDIACMPCVKAAAGGCAGCGEVLSGALVMTGGKKYHAKCRP